MYKIVQLTDLHFISKPQRHVGIDTAKNLESIIQLLKNNLFDEIVITGDLAYKEGLDEIYAELIEKFKIFSCPLTVIPGNHDNRKLLYKYFNANTPNYDFGEYYYHRKTEDFRMIFLDTQDAIVSRNQLEWLNETIFTNSEEHIAIFMHHPPCLCDVKYMDKKYPLKNIYDFTEILNRHKNKYFYIFCGHYHTVKSIHKGNQNIFLSPSAFYMLNPRTEKFHIESHLIGYRSISFSGSNITTRVNLIEGSH